MSAQPTPSQPTSSASGPAPLLPGAFPPPAGSYPGPAGPYSDAVTTPASTSKDKKAAPVPDEGRRRKMLFIVAGALVVLIVFVGILAAGSGGSSKESPAAGREAAAANAVRGYLAALAAGEATKALSYLDKKPASTELLTKAVLSASLEAAKLTDIDVRAGVSDKGVYKVKATFKLGNAGVDQTFEVKERSGWKIVKGTVDVDLSASAGDLPLALNGQIVSDPSSVVLFPGSYALSLVGDTARYVSLGTATFQVTNLDKVKVPTLEPTLTAEGVAAFREAVREAVTACLASPDLDSGCPASGLDIPAELADGTVVTDGTVQRAADEELDAALDALMPRLHPANPALAFASAPEGMVYLAFTATREGQTFEGNSLDPDGEPGCRLGQPLVDMSDLSVTWSGR